MGRRRPFAGSGVGVRTRQATNVRATATIINSIKALEPDATIVAEEDDRSTKRNLSFHSELMLSGYREM
jgi:hypothetical protein